MTNGPAYYFTELITAVKSFITYAPVGKRDRFYKHFQLRQAWYHHIQTSGFKQNDIKPNII